MTRICLTPEDHGPCKPFAAHSVCLAWSKTKQSSTNRFEHPIPVSTLPESVGWCWALKSLHPHEAHVSEYGICGGFWVV